MRCTSPPLRSHRIRLIWRFIFQISLRWLGDSEIDWNQCGWWGTHTAKTGLMSSAMPLWMMKLMHCMRMESLNVATSTDFGGHILRMLIATTNIIFASSIRCKTIINAHSNALRMHGLCFLISVRDNSDRQQTCCLIIKTNARNIHIFQNRPSNRTGSNY